MEQAMKAPRHLIRALKAASASESAAYEHAWQSPGSDLRWEAWERAAHATRAAAQAIVDWRGPAGIVDRLLGRLGMEVA
jgi:hypothetical protein